MKKLVCGDFGTIYYAKILKDGKMSSTDREEMTDDAINAVLYHITSLEGYQDTGFAGYEIPKKNKDGEVCICVYDMNKWDLVKKNA